MPRNGRDESTQDFYENKLPNYFQQLMQSEPLQELSKSNNLT